MVVMSKAKEKKKHAASEKQKQPAGKRKTVKKKNMFWKQSKSIQKAKVENPPTKILLTKPPKDGQLFSANWKVLQETLKSSQTKTNPPKTSKDHNGPLQEKKEKTSKNILPSKTDSGKSVKHKTVDSPVNIPAASETKQPPASKRKNKANGIPNLKKPKLEVKEIKPTAEDIWFDDVDPDDLEATVGQEAADIMRKKMGVQKNPDTDAALVKTKAFEGLTKAIAIDCEMVGVGPDGEDSMLARVSIVNQFGKCLYDKYVKPTEEVTDYRTAYSGIRPKDIRDGEDIATVQKEVAEILKGRILVGHALHNDLKILLLDHPKKKTRDTQKYKPFRKTVRSKCPALRVLCKRILNVKVQQGEHSSVQDAQATMRLYTLVKKHWEAEIKNSKKTDKKHTRKQRLPSCKRTNAGLSFKR